MPANQPKTNKLSIYLIKSAYRDLIDIVESSESALEIDGVGQFVFDESHPHRPDWLIDFFGNSLNNNLNIFSSSAKGVLIVPVQSGAEMSNFAIAFGVGRHLLKEGVVEERFGLKVVLNSVNQGGFRSIDKTTLGSVPKHSHEQMSRDVAPAEFGIDIEQDLVSSVTGKSNDDKLGKTITGKDALSVSVRTDVTNVAEFLTHCLARFKSTDYKQYFDWIDQIADVRDPHLEGRLNANLVEKLNNGDLNKVWMAVPEVINWSDVKGFRYGKAKRAPLNNDLGMPSFLASLQGLTVTLDLLKGQTVFMISATTDDVGARWHAYRCTYAELNLDGNLYIFNNGKWYSIARGFTDQVLLDFNSIASSAIALPNCDVNDEGAYKILVALHRHVRGDWGELCEEDRTHNETSLKTGLRLVSAYRSAHGARFLIVAEANRKSAAILLPGEY